MTPQEAEIKVKTYPKWVVGLAKFYLPLYPSDMQIIAFVEKDNSLIKVLSSTRELTTKTLP